MRSATSGCPASAGAAACAASRVRAHAAATADGRPARRDPFPTLCVIIRPTHSQLPLRGHILRPEGPTPVCLLRLTSPEDDTFLVSPAAGCVLQQSASRVTAAAGS